MRKMNELTERPEFIPRIERSNVVDISEEDLDEFICKICVHLLSEPLTTQCCRQVFCKQCVEKHVSEYNTCPEVMCKQLLCCESLIPASRPFVNLLGNLKVKCIYVDNGCTQLLRVKDMGSHIKDCEHRPKELCRKCGLIKESQSDHDCVTSLIIDRDKIINQLKKKIELDQNRFQCEIGKLTSEQNALQSELNNVFAGNVNLQTDHCELVSHKNKLISVITKLKTEYDNCQVKITELTGKIEQAVQKLEQIKGTWNNIHNLHERTINERMTIMLTYGLDDDLLNYYWDTNTSIDECLIALN